MPAQPSQLGLDHMGWSDVAADIYEVLHAFLYWRTGCAVTHSVTADVAGSLFTQAEEMGLIDNPDFLPPQQKKESLQGYLRRLMINCLQTRFAHIEGLAKCFSFMYIRSKFSSKQFITHFCNTLAEVIIKCSPQSVAFISPPRDSVIAYRPTMSYPRQEYW